MAPEAYSFDHFETIKEALRQQAQALQDEKTAVAEQLEKLKAHYREVNRLEKDLKQLLAAQDLSGTSPGEATPESQEAPLQEVSVVLQKAKAIASEAPEKEEAAPLPLPLEEEEAPGRKSGEAPEEEVILPQEEAAPEATKDEEVFPEVDPLGGDLAGGLAEEVKPVRKSSPRKASKEPVASKVDKISPPEDEDTLFYASGDDEASDTPEDLDEIPF